MFTSERTVFYASFLNRQNVREEFTTSLTKVRASRWLALKTTLATRPTVLVRLLARGADVSSSDDDDDDSDSDESSSDDSSDDDDDLPRQGGEDTAHIRMNPLIMDDD